MHRCVVINLKQWFVGFENFDTGVHEEGHHAKRTKMVSIYLMLCTFQEMIEKRIPSSAN